MPYLMYDPQDFGVEIIYEWYAVEPDYDFDIVLCVRDLNTRKFYVASDSGCSCPVPFEDHKFPADFTEVTSWADVKTFIETHYPENRCYRPRKPLDDFRTAARNALRRK